MNTKEMGWHDRGWTEQGGGGMRLEELTAYAEEKYRIREEYKWSGFPGFSVLRHPSTGKWLALLMRHWDGERGEMAEGCDLKCGQDCLTGGGGAGKWLSRPFRMHSRRWAGVRFGPATDKGLVLGLFDRAVRGEEEAGTCTIVLGSQLERPAGREAGEGHGETPIEFGGGGGTGGAGPAAPGVPERIRQMAGLYVYGSASEERRAWNFVRQGRFMADYEDDAPWEGALLRYFPTYHDLNTRQLRGYFTWRTRWRRGERIGTSASMAYLHVYELLNGIGTASAEDALRQMEAFGREYVEAGFGDEAMRRNLRRWMLEFAVLEGVHPERAARCADPEWIRLDRALATVRHPEGRDDGEVAESLRELAGGKPFVLPAEGIRLLADAWRMALRDWRGEDGKDLFAACFGEMRRFPWRPLSNAVHWRGEGHADAEYMLDEFRVFRCRGGVWTQSCHERLYFDLERLRGFLHEAELRLRRHFRTGHYLREKPGEAWARPFVEAAIAEELRRKAEAARPKIDLRPERLAHIREDAMVTRDSLLPEEESEEADFGGGEPEAPVAAFAGAVGMEPERNVGEEEEPVETRILRMLLRGESPDGLIRERKLMASVVADTLNETYFDDIGDNVVSCDGGRLALVGDYIEDLKQTMGRTS